MHNLPLLFSRKLILLKNVKFPCKSYKTKLTYFVYLNTEYFFLLISFKKVYDLQVENLFFCGSTDPE